MDAKTLCLGALTCGPASGYEIRKLFEEGAYATLHPIGFGSIYPALTALLADGLVECSAEEQSGRPDKKVYRLTDAGVAALAQALLGEPQTDKYRSDTLFMLTLADFIPAERIRWLLDQHRASHQAELDKMLDCDPADMPAGSRFVHGLGLTVYRAVIDHIDRHGDALVAAIAAGRDTTTSGSSAGTAEASGGADRGLGGSSRTAAK